MNDISKMLEDDAGAEASTSDLSLITELVKTQVMLEGNLARLAAETKEITAQLNNVRDVQLPDTMKAVGLSQFVTDDGLKVDVKDELTCSVPAKRKAEIIQRLRDWGHDGIISNEFIIKVDKGDDNKVGVLVAQLEELGLEGARVENVNTTTLKALLNDRLGKGEDTDLSFFGAFKVRRAKISQ
jgi:hypothetical protein